MTAAGGGGRTYGKKVWAVKLWDGTASGVFAETPAYSQTMCPDATVRRNACSKGVFLGLGEGAGILRDISTSKGHIDDDMGALQT